MFKNTLRRYRKYRYDRRYDYPAMFMSITLALELLKVLAVAGIAYGVYFLVTQYL